MELGEPLRSSGRGRKIQGDSGRPGGRVLSEQAGRLTKTGVTTEDILSWEGAKEGKPHTKGTLRKLALTATKSAGNPLQPVSVVL